MLTLSDEENRNAQAFFFSVRVFEISRALIFTEPTFLTKPEWRAAIDMYWIHNPNSWTPKEALFDILPQFGDLGIRTLQFVSDVQNMPQSAHRDLATSLAQEGLTLQSRLLQWHSESIHWISSVANGDRQNTEMAVAYIYYHTVTIFLDGIFSYHPPFTFDSSPPSPILSRATVNNHVELILALSQDLLTHGSAGILLFFPLRVAGARARDPATQSEILHLLQVITQRGFAVAQSFVDDLRDVWAER